MMQYRDRRKNNIFNKVAISLIAIAVVYVFNFTSLPGLLANGMHTIGVPLWELDNSMKETGSVLSGLFGSKAELAEENNNLKDEIRQLSLKLVDRNLLREENMELKKLLSRDEEDAGVLGVILARPNQTPYDSLIVDVGEKHKVSVGDYVIAESVVIGEIEEVFTGSAKVSLFSTPGNEVSALLGGDHVPVTVMGMGGGNYLIRLPRDIPVKLGDNIEFAYIEPTLLGTVSQIDMLPNDPFKQVRFSSPVNLFTIKFVEVVPKNNISSSTYE